ncbi:MAG: hypothetical protein IT430_07400 [Phycisphaerales bacterium]|nr:hypothetical protein [Phycisphaerales bacterium]
MLTRANTSLFHRHLALAAPIFGAALWLLAPASTALAADPPCRRGPTVHRTSVRIVIGGRLGDRRDRSRCDSRCDDRCDGRHDDRWGDWDRGRDWDRDRGRDYGRHDDLLYRGDSRFGGDRYYGLDSQAWCELTSGRYTRAKRDFLDQIECHPCEPVPRIGYSIACGRLEHWREAESSMRRAVELDVKAFDAICVDSDLRREIRCLLDQYESQLRHCSTEADVHFMIASLQSLLGNWNAALCSIENAQRFGDCSVSARELECFIESHLKCEPHREGRETGRGRH